MTTEPAYSQSGCSGLAPAPEMCGSGCRNLALRAFVNKPRVIPFPSQSHDPYLQNLTDTTNLRAKPSLYDLVPVSRMSSYYL